MDADQIILIAIIVLLGVISVFGVYLLMIYLYNKKHEKKMDTIFDTDNLVEEESLLNVMDEKKNIEYDKPSEDDNTFVNETEDVQIVKNETSETNEQINPFGIDMTPKSTTNDNISDQSENKFFN